MIHQRTLSLVFNSRDLFIEKWRFIDHLLYVLYSELQTHLK